MTARQIIEARLGRPLGPIATMPRDLRRALYLLALQLVKSRVRKPLLPMQQRVRICTAHTEGLNNDRQTAL